jgi:short-chain fatty acids transporter
MVRLAQILTRLSERWIPSAFVIACLLTCVIMTAALGLTPSGPTEVLRYWGDGFWILLKFGMQMCLIIMTGSVIADSPPMRRALDTVAGLARSDRGAVVLTAATSMILCWLHWGLGLIASAFLARQVARRRPGVDFRLLVAAAYFGMGALWHAGLSGSATLLVATPGHFLEPQVGVLPISQTIFSALNMGLGMTTFIALCLLAYFVYPRKKQDVFLLDKARRANLEDPPEPLGTVPKTRWLNFWERSYAVCALLGVLGVGYLVADTAAHGFRLTLDKLNFIFLLLALVLQPSPAAFVRAAEKGAGYTHGIIVQFPLYAGMFGIIKGSGLGLVVSGAFIAAATPETYPFIVYIYSGLLNTFVPSGGSQWAVSAPYLLDAGRALGVPVTKTLIAFCWGDMVTNTIQPFWCLPLLAIARLEFKDIMGYQVLVLAVCGLLGSAAFLLF